MRTVSKLIALLATSLAFTLPPTPEHMEVFYQQYIEEARDSLPGVSPVNDDALSRFTDARFIIWDYLTILNSAGELKSVAKADLPAHFDDLNKMVVNRKMRRAIIFIQDPSTHTFFEYDNEDSDTSFIGKMRTLVSDVQAANFGFDFDISVVFEPGDPQAWQSSAPAAPGTGSITIPTGFPNLDQQMNWTYAIIAKVPQIKEVVLMTDGIKSALRAPSILYADEYKWTAGVQDKIRLAITVGLEESKRAYAYAYPIPAPTLYSASIPGYPTSIPSWRSGNNESLLQSVYVEAYSVGSGTQEGSRIPAMFAAGYNKVSGKHDGKLAATFFNSMLRDQPYLAGSGFKTAIGQGDGVGTISFIEGTNAPQTVTGNGTTFGVWDLPLLFAYDSAISSINKMGLVSNVSSNTSATVSTSAFASNGFIPFQRTELVTSWNTPHANPQTPDLTQDIVDKIYWMFSLNYDPTGKQSKGKAWAAFFGNWQLPDFMDFTETSYTLCDDVSTPVFVNGAKQKLNFPKYHFVVFQYNFATSFVGGTISESGRTIDWHLLQEGTTSQ